MMARFLLKFLSYDTLRLTLHRDGVPATWSPSVAEDLLHAPRGQVNDDQVCSKLEAFSFNTFWALLMVLVVRAPLPSVA